MPPGILHQMDVTLDIGPRQTKTGFPNGDTQSSTVKRSRYHHPNGGICWKVSRHLAIWRCIRSRCHINSLLTLLVHNLALFSCAIYHHLKLNVRVVLTIILIPPFLHRFRVSSTFTCATSFTFTGMSNQTMLSRTLASVALKSTSSIPTVWVLTDSELIYWGSNIISY